MLVELLALVRLGEVHKEAGEAVAGLGLALGLAQGAEHAFGFDWEGRGGVVRLVCRGELKFG